MKPLLLSWVTLMLLGTIAMGKAALIPQDGRGVYYQLVEGSFFLDDNLLLDRRPIPVPIRGSFVLVRTGEDPLYMHYEVQGLEFALGTDLNITGAGTYQIGGEVGVSQQMTLDLEIQGQARSFTNDTALVSVPPPMVHLSLTQTNQDAVHIFHLQIKAAPFREIWFSTDHSFSSGSGPALTRLINADDALSTTGAVVKKRDELVTALALTLPPDVPAIDAQTVGQGGELLFSLRQDLYSKTLQTDLLHGDLLSNRGRRVKTNQELIKPLGPIPLPLDVGLVAAQMLDNGEILFSIRDRYISEKLGPTLEPGYIYSSQGYVVRSLDQLYARYAPDTMPGLDAFFVWPESGEVWFSPMVGFQDGVLGPILDGDILSDQGYVVYHNLELVSRFSPLEDVNNFGLDAIYVITDVAPAMSAGPTLTIRREAATGGMGLSWQGAARLYQIEKRNTLLENYVPASPIQLETDYIDFTAALMNPATFYRLRQW